MFDSNPKDETKFAKHLNEEWKNESDFKIIWSGESIVANTVHSSYSTKDTEKSKGL